MITGAGITAGMRPATRWGSKITLRVSLGLLILAATTVVAHADVKAGVDAWSRGDYADAVAQWQAPAAKGDADAMFNMGQAYKLGRGVPKDLARAEDYYRRAADRGHVRAADNYGILLFQTNRQADAIPWLNAAADRGEPRAMYILGIAAYNGEYVAKDWVRAYALMSRAASSGLQMAVNSLSSMNEAIPLEQRQQGVAMAQELDRKASVTRASEMGAADLGGSMPPPTKTARSGTKSANRPMTIATADPMAPVMTSGPVAPAEPAIPAPAIEAPAIQAVDLPPAMVMAPPSAMPPRGAMTAPTAPITAGAGYADPVTLPMRPTRNRPMPAAHAPLAEHAPPAEHASTPPRATTPAPASMAPHAAVTGDWRIQLGAFGQKANADALWAKARTRPAVAGHPRIDVGSPVARLQAGGYSQAEAQSACATLKAAGLTCLVVNH